MKELINVHKELELIHGKLHKGWLFLTVVVSLTAALAIVLLGAINWYNTSLESVGAGSSKLFTVEPGASATEIAQKLEQADLVRSSTAFLWYVQSNGVRANLKAGTYELSPTDDVATIVDELSLGIEVTTTIQVGPGLRLEQVQEQLINSEVFEYQEIVDGLKAGYQHEVLASNADKSQLEGYIFPDTYSISYGASFTEFMDQVLTNFDTKITDDIRSAINDQGLTLHEAVILASIVQQEISDPDQQRVVAQVFLKRLREEINLGSDVTFVYAARVSGEFASPELDSPYNTRIYSGLPPGPIGNFNISALKAVANPADTNYLFFVAGDDGETYFANTVGEHEENVQKHCIELCSLEILN